MCFSFPICRRGNKTDHFHCDKCNICMAQSLKENHKCFADRGHLSDPCAMCYEVRKIWFILVQRTKCYIFLFRLPSFMPSLRHFRDIFFLLLFTCFF